MVTITSSGNSVQFTFQNCPTYLNNGKIELPKSSLALVIDESNMATFKKAASNDIFVSVSLDELDMTKDELIAYYINNMVSTGGGGESGVTPEEVTQMINTAIAPLEQDIDFLQDDVDDVSGAVETLSSEIDVKEQVISTAINELYDDVETLSGQVQTISSQTEGKADTTALTAHTSDATIHVTASDKTAWNGKLDADALAPYWTSAQTDTAITQATSGKANASAVEALSDEIDAKEEVISTAINELYDGLDDVADDVTTVSGNVSTLTTTVTGIQTDLGGIKLVKLTRAQYEALAVKDTNTLYIIPDE